MKSELYPGADAGRNQRPHRGASRHHRRHITLSLCSVTLAMTACGHSRELTRAEFARSAIYTRAEYERAPRLTLDGWRSVCHRSDPRCAFRHVAAGNVDAFGNAILSRPGDVLEEFDSSGTYVRSIGYAGTGVGEYRSAADLAIDGHGAVTIFDQGTFRLLMFDSLGKFTHAVPMWPFKSFVGAVVRPGGAVIVTMPPGDSAGQPVQATFSVLDPSGNSLHGLITVRAPALTKQSSGGLMPLAPFFMPRARWAGGADGSITYTDGASSIVERYDSAGHGELFLQAGVPAHPVTAAEVEAARKQWLASMPTDKVRAITTRDVNRRAAHAAKVHSIFTRVRVLSDGTTWLREEVTPATDSVRWDAFHPSGEWLGWTELPASTRILGGRAGRLLVVTSDTTSFSAAGWMNVTLVATASTGRS